MLTSPQIETVEKTITNVSKELDAAMEKQKNLQMKPLQEKKV